VEGYRDAEGKVRHRVVANLGRRDALKRSGVLDRLAGTFARLDPPRIGIRREVGPLLVIEAYLRRLGLQQIIQRALPERDRAQLTTAEVVVALIANRLCAPSPLYDVSGWASSAALHELFGIPAMLLNDDRLGRALERFAPQAEAIRGAVALAAIERFGLAAGRLHLDVAALRVYGAHEASSLVARGWNAERRVQRQVQVLQAATHDGIALYVRPEAGNAAELQAVGAALERLAKLLPPGLVICADAALGHFKNLLAAERAGLQFVVPLRASTGFHQRFLREVGHNGLSPIRYVARRDQHLPPGQRIRHRGALRPWLVFDVDTKTQHHFRVAYIWSSEEERSVREARERALRACEDDLRKLQRGLSAGKYTTEKEVRDRVANILGPAVRDLLTVTVHKRDKRLALTFDRRHAAIAAAKELDGIYALATNLPGRIAAGEILRRYKQQSLIEWRHRDLKGPLRVRPIFLHNDDRITALISIVGLALTIFGLVEHDLRQRLAADDALLGLLPEGRAARPTGRNILAAFQGLGLTYTAHGIRLDRLTAIQRRILQLLQVVLPWPELSAA
jgi:hypothetical protein